MTLASVLDPARSVEPAAYALGGREPKAALKPASSAEVSAALEAAHRDGLVVAAWGAGTRMARDRAPARYDLALDLTGLDRILEYEPEDFTLTAECGVSLDTLRQALHARGQELPLESPRINRATLGGALATNASGPRRYRFGAPRDRILGAQIALPDGTRVKSGGKVVKNVAGYSLHRLLCGARGRWGLFLEASLKLAPGPETRVALVYATEAREIADVQRWRFLPRLEPAFVTVLGAEAARALPLERASSPGYRVVIGLEDDAAWVGEQERTIVASLGTPAVRVEGDEQRTWTQALADAETQAGPRWTFTSAHNTVAGIAPLLAMEGADRIVHHAPAGRLHWFPGHDARTGGASPAFAAAGFTAIDATGGSPEGAIPTESSVLALRERIRQALDPRGSLEAWAPAGPSFTNP